MNQLKAGAALNYVILGLNALLGLLYTPYMLRILGQSEYGIYSLAASIIAYLSILDLGFGNAVIRYTAKFRAEGKVEEQYRLFGMFTILYSLIGVLVLCAGVVLLCNLDTLFGQTLSVAELERTRIVTLLMIVNLAVTFPLSIYGAIITAYENFVFLRVVQILRIVGTTAVMIALLSMGYKAVALVVVQTVFNMLTLGLNIFYCRKKIRIKISFRRVDYGLVKEVAVFSFWVFLNAIMDRIYWSTGQFVLGATAGTTAISVFAVAIQLQSMYMMFSSGISGVFLPRVTALVTHHESPRVISDLFIRVGRIQYVIISFILSAFILFGRSFIAMWAGAGYEDTYVITLLFFIPLSIPLVQSLAIIILQARNQMKFRCLLYLAISLGSLLLQIPLARHYGGIGCACAIGGALLLGQGLVINIYYQRKQNIDIVSFWKEILHMSTVPVLVAVSFHFLLACFPVDTVPRFAVAVSVYTLIYVPLFYRFSMNNYERGLVRSFAGRLGRIKEKCAGKSGEKR